jgi:Domain of unknown function (DUF3846)
VTVGTLITPGAAPRFFGPADGRAVFSLKELQTAVGGYIEVVRAPYLVDDAPTYLVLNEDGKRLNLPINRFATAMYHAAGGARDDVIVGNVVLATHRELQAEDDGE